MYPSTPYGQQQYKQTSVETADRGRLVVLIYDHCIKWCGIAREAVQANNTPRKAMAVQKVQAGITELVCSLDMEKGGEVAQNLRKLYDFYNRHLLEGSLHNQEQNFVDVQTMMASLREAWSQALVALRQSNDVSTLQASAKKSYVSMVG